MGFWGRFGGGNFCAELQVGSLLRVSFGKLKAPELNHHIKSLQWCCHELAVPLGQGPLACDSVLGLLDHQPMLVQTSSLSRLLDHHRSNTDLDGAMQCLGYFHDL